MLKNSPTQSYWTPHSEHRGEEIAERIPGLVFEKYVSSCLTWILVLSVAAASAILLGILGIGFSSDFSVGQFDVRYFYVAGKCLWFGMSPYEPSNFAFCSDGFVGLSNSGYLYPPPFATVAILLSWLPFSAARATVVAINLIALVYLSLYCMRGLDLPSGRIVPPPGVHWLIPAIILGNPFTAHVLWLGQTSLVVTAALAAGWMYGRRPRDYWLGGIFIGIATIKPQFSLLPILWLFLDGRLATLAVGALVSLLLSLPEMIIIGPVKSFNDWISALANYRALGPNGIDDPHVFGIQSFLAALGIEAPSLFGIGTGLTIMLWWFRSHFEDWAILPMLAGLAVLFGFSHDYDLVVLVLMLPAFLVALRDKRTSILLAACWTILLCLPNRLAGLHPSLLPGSPVDPDNLVLVRFRVIVVLAFCVWLLFLSIRRKPPMKRPSYGLTR